MFHPFQLITGIFPNLIWMALVAANIYFLREWYEHKDILQDEQYAKLCLGLVVLCFFFNFFGKFFFQLILGKNGDDEPNMIRSDETKTLIMPEGHEIFLEFYGNQENQPIIFIHGWSSNSLQWYYFKKHLSKNYRLILMDLPGLGNSTKKTNNQYSPDGFARDLDAVVKEAGGHKKPIILGHSIGGMIILSYCKLLGTELSNKVAGLVLVQTTYTNPVKTSVLAKLLILLEKPLLRPLCYIMIILAPLFQITNWMKYLNGSLHINNHFTGFARTETKGQLNLMTLLSNMAPVDVVGRGILGMFEYDATQILPNIDVPVLILAGDQDLMCKPEASEFMKNNIPNSTLKILQPCGHLGTVERNDQMIKAVDEFAQKIK
jgi:pimeloyl-ACP methyl ester carboxylesterase